MEVLLFGIIAEKAGKDRMTIVAASMPELRDGLLREMPFLGSLSYAIAVDRRIVREDRALTGNEEIALLPPFAGG